MDIGTALALFGSAPLATRLLGPTVDYIGEEIKQATQRRIANLRNIFLIALRRVGDRIDTDGTVPPRVLKAIMDEGSFCEDAVAAEYLGGVLASSRTEGGRDDRGVYFTRLIGRLSVYQLRTHYILYHILKVLFNGKELDPSDQGRWEMQSFVPMVVYGSAMEFRPDENVTTLTNHAVLGLVKETLLDDEYEVGDVERQGSNGILFQPSGLGTELFLAAYGIIDLEYSGFLDPARSFECQIAIQPGAYPTYR